MAFDNTNTGILFKNDRKETDRHPDYRGSINIAGREYWLSGWRKDTQKGPALSLSVKPKQQEAPAPVAGPIGPQIGDEIPF